MLNIQNLSLSFGDSQILRAISFSVKKGEMLAVVGESGSGKSLTALACLGLQPASASVSGSIVFNGEELLSPLVTPAKAGIQNENFKKLRGKEISMIFQEPMTALNPLHTIGMQIGEMLAADDKNRIGELLEQVGLEKFKNRLNAYPHQLSGGERQRVMIAMAIANNPDLLIADEPTTAVDVTIQVKILKLLKNLQKSMGMAMIFITHDLTLVRRLADRVIVMHKGEIVEQGLVAEVFANPQHSYTKHLLGSEPKNNPLPVPANAKIIMECQNLKVYFPIKTGLLQRISGYIKAVDDISITLAESSTLGIVGESGSGKTTLGFALLRLIKSNGRVIFLGKSIDDLKTKTIRPLRAQMQLVFQDPYSSLNPRMRVREVIAEGMLVHYPQKTSTERENEIDQILQEVGLPLEAKDRYPHEFSGGQRQRISIARAMVLHPKLVVLDEPTSALDLSVQSQIIDLLQHFQKTRGISYLFISHDLRVVRAIAQNLIVMKNGKIMEQGNTAEIFKNPQHEYTKTLIDAAFLGTIYN
ncbi:MAG: ABC transporter ATP-binding protein [Rickettsiales bacterium]